jgi:uncharacterized protein (TIGR02270 family)
VALFRSIEPVEPLNAGDRVLWEVVEEHLDEAEFCFEQFEHQLDHPGLSLAQLAGGVEARLLAHLDALVVGGSVVAERLLAPQLAEADPARPARITATALALVAAARIDLVEPALFHEQPAVRRAAVRAFVLLADASLDRWVLSRLGGARSDRELQPLLELTAQRSLIPPDLFPALASPDPMLVASAARAARFGDPRAYLSPVESLLAHPDLDVRHAALTTALIANSRHAWNACEAWALDETAPTAPAMTLYAALGGPPQHAALARQLTHPAHRPAALFALGFSGNAALVPVLIRHLESDDPREAKLAAQAISTIIGIDLEQDELAAPDETQPVSGDGAPDTDDALPALEEDLELDLTTAPEDALPRPNAVAITRLWQGVSQGFHAGTRYLGGQPHARLSVLEYLERAPMRRRHAVAAAWAVTSAGVDWLDTRAFSRSQRERLTRIRGTL